MNMNFINSKIIFLSGFFLFFLSLFVILSSPRQASAVYDGGRLIDDPVFLNAASMSAQDVQNFLSARGGAIANASFVMDCASTGSQSEYAYSVLGAPCGQQALASHIIYYAAQVYGVNPRVIIATMQKEQSLITATNPTNRQYVQAMGYGCPTTGGCDDTSNFLWQIDNGTWVLRWHYERARGNNTWWRTTSSWTCGTEKNFYKPNLYPGQNVNFYDEDNVMYRTHFITNAATSAFYCYTPHAYNNPQGLYGRAPFGTTGRYYSGSYNFVYYYDLWFGSSWADAYSAQPVWQSVFTDSTKTQSLGWGATLRTGQTAYVAVAMRNIGNNTWYRQNGSIETMLGTTGGQDRISGFCTGTWTHPCNRPARLIEASVAPGQTGTFEFPISAPGQPGTYNESFGIVVNGYGYIPNSFTVPFTVEAARNAAQPVWQSVYTDSTKTQSLGWNATLRAGQSAYAVVHMKNTGNMTWTKTNGGNDVMLGTVLGQDRQSVFCTAGWLYPCNRPVRLIEASVAPGQTGTFEFPITAPQTPGLYSESFGLVVNGKGYFPNGYMSFQITVEPERNSAQAVWQGIYTNSSKTQLLGWGATLTKGQSVYAVVAMKNTGNMTWTKTNGGNDVMLGTVLGQDRQSVFCTAGWLYPCNRPVRLIEASVAPGQTGTFEFPITAPQTPGLYSESFGLVVNGKGYFPNGYMSFPVQVN